MAETARGWQASLPAAALGSSVLPAAVSAISGALCAAFWISASVTGNRNPQLGLRRLPAYRFMSEANILVPFQPACQLAENAASG
jgi:hypothetical protein